VVLPNEISSRRRRPGLLASVFLLCVWVLSVLATASPDGAPMLALAHLISAFLGVFLVLASPAQETFVSNNKPYDVQVCFFSR
jgi:hypothetical protein